MFYVPQGALVTYIKAYHPARACVLYHGKMVLICEKWLRRVRECSSERDEPGRPPMLKTE